MAAAAGGGCAGAPDCLERVCDKIEASDLLDRGRSDLLGSSSVLRGVHSGLADDCKLRWHDMRLGRGSSAPVASDANLEAVRRQSASLRLAIWPSRAGPRPCSAPGICAAPPEPGAQEAPRKPLRPERWHLSTLQQTQERIWEQRVRIRGGVGFCSTPSVHFSHSARALSPSPADPGARPGGHAPPSSRSWGQRRPPACRPRPTIVCVGRRTRRGAHLERWRIWRRLRCRRRVLFFFHFHRNLARDFLYGFDLCAMPGAPCGRESRRVVRGWAVEQPRGCCVWCVRVPGDGSGQEQSRLASGTWASKGVCSLGTGFRDRSSKV